MFFFGMVPLVGLYIVDIHLARMRNIPGEGTLGV
jgi:hypothetical protein